MGGPILYISLTNLPPAIPFLQDLSQGCASAKSGAEVARRLAHGVKVNVEDPMPGETRGTRGKNRGKSVENAAKTCKIEENLETK